MSDLTGYRQQVGELGKAAVQAEKDGNWEQAYDNYVSALKIFMHMLKCKYNILCNSKIICRREK